MSDQLVWDSKPHDMPRTVTSLTRNAHSLAMSESGELSSNAFINNLLQQWITIIGMSNKESQLVSYSSKSGRITGWLENKKKTKISIQEFQILIHWWARGCPICPKIFQSFSLHLAGQRLPYFWNLRQKDRQLLAQIRILELRLFSRPSYNSVWFQTVGY